MSVELNVRTTTIVRLAGNLLARTLRRQCWEPIGNVYVDHVDVARSAIAVVTVAGDVVLHVPVDVFVVSEAAVAAAPNGTPAGASVPLAGVPPLRYRIEVRTLDHEGHRRPQIVFVGLPVGAGLPPGFVAPPIPPVDLTRFFEAWDGMPNNGDVSVVGDVTVFRFDGSGPPSSHLAADHEWGVYVSVATWDRFIRARLEPALEGVGFEVGVEHVTWHARATSPGFDVRVGTHRDVGLDTPLGKISANVHAWADIDCVVGLATAAGTRVGATLGLTAAWSVHVDVEHVPGALESLAESLAAEMLNEALDPGKFGAVPAGPRRFSLTLAVRALELFGVTLPIQSLANFNEGATLGGAVFIRPFAEPPFALEPSRLSPPFRNQLCSELAKTGSGAPDKSPLSLSNTSCVARAYVRGGGRLCRYEVSAAGPDVSGYVTVDDSDDENLAVNVRIPYTVAIKVTGPLRVLVRTARGVRLLDFGPVPHVDIDKDGVILNGYDWYLKNCLHLVPGTRDRPGGKWGREVGDALGIDDTWTVDQFKTRPPEEPDWAQFVAVGAGVSVQLVTLNGLEPGELVQYRSATHAVDVSADVNGRALIPVFLPFTSMTAQIERVNRQPLPATAKLAVLNFEHRTMLGNEEGQQFALSTTGDLVRTRTADGATVHDLMTDDGAIRRDSAVELNPQPLPPTPPDEVDLVGLNPPPLPPEPPDERQAGLNPQPLPPEPPDIHRQLGIRVIDVVAIPGFETAPVSIGVMEDGSKLLIDVTDGHMRVAGAFHGPVGQIDRLGAWGTVAGAAATAVLGVVGATADG